MDKGLLVVTIACVAMLAFFVGYQLSIGGSSNDGQTNGGVDWDTSIAVDLTLKIDSIEVSHSDPVAVEGSRATILFGGTYRITGSLSDGQIVVYTDDEDPVRLILNGVNINCSTSAAISIMDAEEAFIILADGTENYVMDAATYVYGDPSEDEPNAAVFCKSDLTILGNGVLNVVGNYNDGIASKDGLVIESGTVSVRSVDDGIRGRDYIVVKNGDLNLDVGGDGLKSDNPENATLGNISVENGTINIVSGGDAFQAEKNISITGGSFSLKAGGGSSSTVDSKVSTKGIKGLVDVTIDSGIIEIDAADDAIHSNGTITLNGGSFTLLAGDDAIHADKFVEVNGGNINVVKSFEGIESALVTINNGNLQIISADDGIDAILNVGDPNSGSLSIVNGAIDIVSGGDAIQAGKNVVIADGDFALTSGGGSHNIVAVDVSAKGVKGVSSVVINGGTYTISSADDSLHSNGAITVNAGSFTLSSSDDGIHADGSVEINGGDIKVAEAFEGIEGATVTVNGGDVSIFSSDDGIDAVATTGNSNTGVISVTNGVIDIKAGGDAIQAETDVLITGGTFNLKSGGGSLNLIGNDFSAKGIKGVASVTINSGTFTIDSADDTIHSNGNVMISGGAFTLLTGDDTIHGGVSVAVSGGNMNVVNSPDLGGQQWDTSTIVDVTLKGSSIEVSAVPPVYVSGNKMMIRSAGTYRITGALNDGQIIVNTKTTGLVKLILSGVRINCSTNSPICVLDADKVEVFLVAGTENFVSDASAYVFGSSGLDEPNAAIYSRSDLTISGTGALTVDANYNDGVASKDGLVIESGAISVNSVDDGIRGRDYIVVKNGVIDLDVSGDGMKSDNPENATLGYISVENGVVDVVAGGDAMTAETRVLITGGNFYLKTGGGSGVAVGANASAKGIKGSVSVTIEGGVFTINSSDDAVHSNGAITISGGSLVLSTADDGIHADASITINDGEVNIIKSYEGIEAPVMIINDGDIHVAASDDGVNLGVDSGIPPGQPQPGARLSLYSGSYYLYINGGYLAVDALGDGIDSNGAVVMNGGIVIVNGPSSDMNSALDHVAFNITAGYMVAAGSSGMALPPGDLSTQYSVMLNFQTAYQAGTLISVRASNGTELFTFRPTRRYQSIVFSMPNLSLGSTYEVYVGGSHTGTIKDGLYSGGTYAPGTRYTTFTITAKVTRLGPSGGFFPPLP
jgi:hypothetical protein